MDAATFQLLPPVYPPEVAALRDEARRLLGEMDALMGRELEPAITRFAEVRARWEADPERYEGAYRRAYDALELQKADWFRQREYFVSKMVAFEVFAQPRIAIAIEAGTAATP